MSRGMVSPVFAGRETELAELAAAFTAAAGGTPGTVLVGGEAGCGKSRLASEFTQRMRARATITNVLEGRGDHELAIQAGREGLARARQLGLTRQIAAPIAGNLAESLASAGRWDEAVEILDEVLSLDLPPLGRSHALQVRGQIAVARGELEIAAHALEQLRSLPAGARAETQRLLPLTQFEIDYSLARGDLPGALNEVREVPEYNLAADPRYPWPLPCTFPTSSASSGPPRAARPPPPPTACTCSTGPDRAARPACLSTAAGCARSSTSARRAGGRCRGWRP